MNRLQQDRHALGIRPHSTCSEQSLNRSNHSAHHRFFIPLHYEKNYAYPLFVWLHGPGGTEAEINHVMPHVSLRNYVGVATRGVIGYGKSRLERQAFSWDQSARSVERGMNQVLNCIAEAKRRFNIAKDRVFLVGNDVGGTMALRLGLMAPERFGGVVSLGAGLPVSHQPLAGIKHARKLPLLLAHCRDSNSHDADSVCSDLRLLHTAGMKVWLRQYPCEQEVTTNMLSDVNTWIMERILGPQSSPQPTSSPYDSTHARLEDFN